MVTYPKEFIEELLRNVEGFPETAPEIGRLMVHGRDRWGKSLEDLEKYIDSKGLLEVCEDVYVKNLPYRAVYTSSKVRYILHKLKDGSKGVWDILTEGIPVVTFDKKLGQTSTFITHIQDMSDEDIQKCFQRESGKGGSPGPYKLLTVEEQLQGMEGVKVLAAYNNMRAIDSMPENPRRCEYKGCRKLFYEYHRIEGSNMWRGKEFCSLECYYRRGQEEFTCASCGEMFWAPYYSTQRYCSRACACKGRSIARKQKLKKDKQPSKEEAKLKKLLKEINYETK